VAVAAPPVEPHPKGGRPRVQDRAVVPGLLFVLRSGLPGQMLPADRGEGRGQDVLAPLARGGY
jgi:transposase